MRFLSLLLLASSLLSFGLLAKERPPNIIIMFTDDQGYGDLGCYGAKGFKTPHIDSLAKDGMKFTDFYVSSPVCSASRVSLMTGCYHERVGISGALGPSSTIGINPEETTIAEVCKAKGYATAAVGKWHLGHLPKFLPTNHGFDQYFGLPYANDMWPFHPSALHLPMEERLKKWPKLPLIGGTKIIDPEITSEEQRQLTSRYTQKAVAFIRRNKKKPFFLYLAHSQPHVPLYVSDKFQGKSRAGVFGDVIEEIDWSMGEILKALKTFKLEDKTLVVFTSDNGPWLSYGDHCGTAGPLREGKGTCWEGGVRVPCVARWPGTIPAGMVCSEVAGTIDLLPTVAKAIGGKLPKLSIDGKDITPLLKGKKNARSPHDALFFHYKTTELQAMRSGKWKLILPHKYRTLNGREGGKDGIPVKYDWAESSLELYDMSKDVGETKNVATDHPEVVSELLEKVRAHRMELGDRLTKVQGLERREPGRARPR